jgi:hypothetical protein
MEGDSQRSFEDFGIFKKENSIDCPQWEGDADSIRQ